MVWFVRVGFGLVIGLVILLGSLVLDTRLGIVYYIGFPAGNGSRQACGFGFGFVLRVCDYVFVVPCFGTPEIVRERFFSPLVVRFTI